MLPLTEAFGARLVARAVPDLPQDLAVGATVVETQDTALPALVTTSTTSAELRQGGTSTMEAEPLLDPYATGLEPLETMLDPFATVVDFRPYPLENTIANQMANELGNIPCINAKV